jgi:predicted O-linked N-acetylglucosamine transferase (SPINDLY family)
MVVCAFHRPVKLDPASLSTWAQIVLSHPSAILWVISYEEYALQNLVRELESRSLSGRYWLA